MRAPTQAGLPSLATILDDLPAPPAKIARHLGISTKTLNRYRSTGQAPRAVMLALFWETRWGRSAADTEAANWGAMWYRQAVVLQRQNDRLQKQIGQLERELAYAGAGAANGPLFLVG